MDKYICFLFLFLLSSFYDDTHDARVGIVKVENTVLFSVKKGAQTSRRRLPFGPARREPATPSPKSPAPLSPFHPIFGEVCLLSSFYRFWLSSRHSTSNSKMFVCRRRGFVANLLVRNFFFGSKGMNKFNPRSPTSARILLLKRTVIFVIRFLSIIHFSVVYIPHTFLIRIP